MSDDARLALTVICLAVGLLAQLGGLLLVVRESRKAARVLRRWSRAAPGQGRPELRDVVGALLDDPFDRGAGAVLLVLGGALAGPGPLLSLCPRGPPPAPARRPPRARRHRARRRAW